MKVFLTFLALFIVNVNMMVFHDDMRIYRYLKNDIETAAETCAQGAAMYFDSGKYAEGMIVYDMEQARLLIETVKQRCLGDDKRDFINNVSVTAYFYDGTGICHVVEDGIEKRSFCFEFPCSSPEDGCTIDKPSVEVFVRAGTDDVFRQPFLEAVTVTGHFVCGYNPPEAEV